MPLSANKHHGLIKMRLFDNRRTSIHEFSGIRWKMEWSRFRLAIYVLSFLGLLFGEFGSIADGSEEQETPKLTIIYGGDLNGYLSPCGCGGATAQLGGLSRSASLIQSITITRDHLSLFVSNGNLVERTGRQSEITYEVALNSLDIMGCSAVNVGGQD